MNYRAIIKGSIISVSIIFIFVIIGALVSYFTDIDNIMRIIGLVGIAISIGVSSFGVSRASDKMKLLNSIIISAITMFVIWLISMVLGEFSGLGVRFITTCVIALGSAALGTFLS